MGIAEDVVKINGRIKALKEKLDLKTEEKEALFNECQKLVRLGQNHEKCLDKVKLRIAEMYAIKCSIAQAEHEKDLKIQEGLIANQKET